MYIDSHCHLTDKRYDSVEQLVCESLQRGVSTLVDVGFDKNSSVLAKNNGEAFENVYFLAGLHPSESLTYTQNDLQIIQSLLSHKKCLGVGEIGLDYHYEGYDKKKQIELFENQIEIAYKNNLPIAIHSRDCSKDMLEVLQSNKNLIKGLLMHCYSESLEQSKNYLDLGGYFAFGGVITFKNSKKEDIIKAIPIDRLLVETDAPYMSPEPFRGRTNYPYNVVLVYEKLASILNIDVNFLCAKVRDNFKRLFKKVGQ